MTLEDIIRILGLKPHPEGGWYAEMHRIPSPEVQRSPGTAIYYALGAGDRSHWHRVDATEIWHHYAGDPIELSLSPGRGVSTHILGPDLAAGQRPQVIVEPHHWQAARSLGAWTLVGCTVSPGFDFAGFEMAPPDWLPPA
ncbi:MAG: cupin domain-containing protein [Hyphomonadaceae bacterium]